MINSIINGICKALSKEFPDCLIYTGSLPQGHTEPCFYVLCINQGVQKYPSGRYKLDTDFCIHYFPKEETDGRGECHAAQDKLWKCLEIIELDDGGPARGTGMSGRIAEGVLQFFVSYNAFVRAIEEEVKMETLEIIQED